MSVDTTATPSGFPNVDERWGGFLPGHAYVLVGRASDGRNQMALRAVHAAVQADQRSLLISPRDKNVLVAEGRKIGLDLPSAHATGRLRLLRIPGAERLSGRGSDGLRKAFEDFGKLIQTDRPDRVVVEDFTPLVQFDSFAGFQDAFRGLLDVIVASKSALVVGLGQPGNDASRQLIEFVGRMVAGVITLSMADGKQMVHLSRHGDEHEAPPAAPAPILDAPSPLPSETAAPALTGFEQPGEAPAPRDASGTQISQVIRPPEPTADLLEPGNDTFGSDPADEIVDQGYLIDSHAGRVVGRIPSAPISHSPKAGDPSVPAFAPLGSGEPEGSPSESFSSALAKAYSDLPFGTPFLFVAVRMEPSIADAAHFGTVAAGLRGSLRPQDHILVDAERKRAAVLLPGVGEEAVKPLYAGLQAHLRNALGTDADSVLHSVGAVSVPNGQPFMTPRELIVYAIDS